MATLDQKLEAVPEMMLRHEFEHVIDTIDEFVARSESPHDVHPGWYVFRGAAQYLDSRFADAISSYLQAIDVDPDYTIAKVNLAYILACCPNPDFHDPILAIHFATDACELVEWKEWHGLQMLAAAYARAADYSAASEYARQAYSLAPKAHQWRVTRVIDCICRQQPYTASIEDDVQKLHSDWEQQLTK